jgi:GDPmannose 4,6-dehydratase
MFGDQTGMLDEGTPMRPTSPYGVSKLASHHLIQAYRNAGIRCVSGILFNHESERRGQEMVTMKICRHVARFAYGFKEPLELGNLEAVRDWGYAPEYVEAMWLMMREAKTDYVIGTGECHSVQELLDTALDAAGLDKEEFKQNWLLTDTRLRRDGEINTLCANASRAEKELGWKSQTTFEQMMGKMVKSEMRKADKP